jgi:hypothetical protein
LISGISGNICNKPFENTTSKLTYLGTKATAKFIMKVRKSILEMLINHVRFQVLTEANMKMTVFLDVAPYSLIEVYRRFRGADDDPDDRGSKHI